MPKGAGKKVKKRPASRKQPKAAGKAKPSGNGRSGSKKAGSTTKAKGGGARQKAKKKKKKKRKEKDQPSASRRSPRRPACEITLDAPPPDMSCPVCLSFLCAAPRTLGCGCDHAICSDCVAQLPPAGACPLCRRGYTTVGPAAQIAADMARQQLQCGCGEVVPLVRLRAHQLECEAERADLAAAASAATASAAAAGRSAPAAAANHHTFACPLCAERNLDRAGLVAHVQSAHPGQRGVCPICAALPHGDQNYVSPNLGSHLAHRHAFDYDTVISHEEDEDAILQRVLRESLASG